MTTFHFAVVATAKVDWMALVVVVVAWWRLFRFARDYWLKLFQEVSLRAA